MQRRLPPLNALRAFEAAARHLHLSRAAGELCVTHGAVSRQVRALEERLGVALFDRGGGGLSLTAEGEALAATARSAFDMLEAGTARLLGGRRDGALVLSCWSTFMMRWLIPRLHRFTERHPNIQFRLSASCAPVEFDRDPVDLAIRLGPQPPREGVAAAALFDEELGPLCSPELLRRAALNRPEQLASLPLLATETRTTAWQEWTRAAGQDGLALPEPQRFEHTFYMLEAAVGGLGVGIAQRALVDSDLKHGRLVAPFGFLPSGRSAYLLYPERLASNPGVKRFRAWLLEEVAARI